MALPRQTSGRVVRLLVFVLALSLVATVGLLTLPSARANFRFPNPVSIAPSKYWGGLTFVPGESMAITIRTTAQDTLDLVIQNGSGTPTYQRTGIAVPATLTVTINFVIPVSWPDSNTYTVSVTDTSSTPNPQTQVVPFTIQTYRLDVWSDRGGYLLGDTAQISWSAVYAQNGTPAPAGTGAIKIQDSAGANILTPPQYNFTQSGGAFSFILAASLTTPDTETIYAWFNDTSGARRSTAGDTFNVGDLGITVNVALPTRGYFEPGESVPVTIRSRILGSPANEPNVAVSVNVTDQATGSVVAAYSNTAMTTDATGTLNYAFQLAQTPASGAYQVTATDSVRGSSATASAPPFDVRPPPAFTANVVLDKSQYISGDTIHATANVVSIGTQTFTYTWWVWDSAGNRLAYQAGGSANQYAFTTSVNYQGGIQMEVAVNNQTGGIVDTSAFATVAFGYLTMTLDKTQFSPGDTITATAHLSSSLITSPTYAWMVQDSAGSVVASMNGTSSSASFNVPSPASSSRYTFTVTASQNGHSVQASQSAVRNDGFVLALTLDKSSYNQGDTITMTYTITAKGVSALPSSYHFVIQLLASNIVHYQDGANPSGTLTLQVPANAPTGNLILWVFETSTGANVYNVVHVGPVNPLVADVGGVPLFDILISLLFIVLVLVVILLWRRTGMGRAPRGPEAAKPSTPPPPPPSGPSQQAAGPMSIACKHCGASIEITTSKRPIEVMCPSCGETQVVQ